MEQWWRSGTGRGYQLRIRREFTVGSRLARAAKCLVRLTPEGMREPGPDTVGSSLFGNASTIGDATQGGTSITHVHAKGAQATSLALPMGAFRRLRV